MCCLSSYCARSMPACLRGGACHRSRARGAACLPTSWPSPRPILSYVCAHCPIAGMPRPGGTDRRPKGPPCKVPTCPDPENASGQWTYLPADFLLKHPELDKDDCHCHKRGCRRDVGKEPPRQRPGRKRVRADSPVVSAGLKAADELPRPPILVSIDEIWAFRHEMPNAHACPLASLLDPCPSPLLSTTLPAGM